ncbi:MAG TPA: alkaline phosphatase family protein [Anaerolineales bacterium]|nr:alkaline phosphatase family protein [Anaerolineales bacterium]
MARTLVIGLDGATFDIIRPLIERGRLPNLARMVREGVSGVLASTVPPVTPAAWTSFFTGKNPGRHGIFDFQRLDYETATFTTVRTDLHAEKPIWQLLGEAGLRSIVWDVPFTYPPRPMPAGGWMLTGYGTPRVPGSVFTYPEDLAERVPAELRPEIRVALPGTNFDRSREFIEAFRSIMAGRRRLLDWLIRAQDWDFFCVVFSITDTMAHVFWTFLDPSHPNYRHPDGPAYREAFFEAYESCDRILGELMAAAGADTTTFVISDHGFGSVRPRQYIYERLMAGDWVAPRGDRTGSARARLARAATKAYVRFPFLREWVKGLGSDRRKALTRGLKEAGMLPTVEGIDLSASKIIPTNFGLRMWVNDTGRFPCGVVAPGEVEDVADELVAFLKSDTDPKNGRPIIRAVHRGRDLYRGPHASSGPDLVIEYENHFDLDAPPRADNPFTEGGHTQEGIFLARGPGIRSTVVEGASLMDLAPTILYLFGLPVPPDMDGRPLINLFDRSFLDTHPVEIGEEPARYAGWKPGSLTDSEEEAVFEQLRRLGYV